MFEQTIIDQNFHWNGQPYSTGVQREILAAVIEHLDLPHILALVGVRRSGKSTLARQMINYLISEKNVPPKNILFLNLETPQFSRHRNDVATLEQIYGDYLKITNPDGTVYCFLDEVHFFSEWQVFVKDQYERKGVKFIVTGSNSRLLSSEFITLLSGRAFPLEVFPFSFMEFTQARGAAPKDQIELMKNRHQLRSLCDEFVCGGGFPEAVFMDNARIRNELLVMYARNILYQDIAPRFGVKKAQELENLFFFLTSNASSLYTNNRLSSLVGLNDKTIKEYISYFADAQLLFTLDLFSFSVRDQVKSAKKVYAIDTGLAAATAFSVSENIGHYLENTVYIELKRKGCELYYYRTSNGLEVDFACRGARGTVVELIQVAYSMNAEKTRNREIKALLKALEETGLTTGTIVTSDEEEILTEAGKTIRIVPAYKYLSGLG